MLSFVTFVVQLYLVSLMKNIYRSTKYKNWKRTVGLKAVRLRNRRKERSSAFKRLGKTVKKWQNFNPIIAPSNFSFTENPEECSRFFNLIRNRNNHYYKDGYYFVGLELQHINKIDYCSVSVLKALLDEFKSKQVQVQGSLPKNQHCNKFLQESGFYDGLIPLSHNKPFRFKGNHDRIMFTKGAGSLSKDEDKKVVDILKRIRKHLTGENKHCPQLRTIILEICGNSIEHSESYNKQWTLGVKYEPDYVTITLLDMGKGIIKTLYKTLGQKFEDFLFKSEMQILEGAFNKKYQSKTQDTNRNKGLPVIKERLNEGFIKNIVVITNNVLLNFDSDRESKKFKEGFKGTIFKIELDKTCFPCK